MAETLDALKNRLAERAEDFCAYLFPDGRVRYGKFYIGDILGNPGKSLVVNVDGANCGLWKDFATGDGGSNLLDLLFQARGVDFSAAIREAEEWLGTAEPGKSSETLRPARISKKPGRVGTNDLARGTPAELRQLANLLRCSLDGVQLASDQDVLCFFHTALNGGCWTVLPVFSEKCNGDSYSWPSRPGCVRQDRRLDGKPFLLGNGTSCKARTIGSPTYPVAHFPLKPNVLLCEGSSDFIAAHCLICWEELQKEFSAVSILGAGNSIAADAVPEFSGRNVLVFPDYDSAGLSGARHWTEELGEVAGAIRFFDYAGLRTEDGQPVKDLREFLRVNPDSFDCHHEVQYPLGAFLVALQTHNTETQNHGQKRTKKSVYQGKN